MKPFSAILVVFSLLLLVSFNHARKDPAGDYWKTMTKDQPIPEAIRDLMIRTGTADHGRFVKDFDIRHNFIIYHAHGGHKDGKSPDAKGHLKPAVLGNQA